MRLFPCALAGATALVLSGCVVATAPGTSPTTTTPAVSQLESQLNNRSIRSDIFAGQLTAGGAINGGHDLYGRGGSWSVNGSTLCLNFGFTVTECGPAEIANGVLVHYVPGPRGPIGYDMQ